MLSSFYTWALSIATIRFVKWNSAGHRTNRCSYATRKTQVKSLLLCQQCKEEVCTTPGIKPQQILSINHLPLWLSVASKQSDRVQISNCRLWSWTHSGGKARMGKHPRGASSLSLKSPTQIKRNHQRGFQFYFPSQSKASNNTYKYRCVFWD